MASIFWWQRDVPLPTANTLSNFSICTVTSDSGLIFDSSVSVKLLPDLLFFVFRIYIISSHFFFLTCFSPVVTQFSWSVPWGSNYIASGSQPRINELMGQQHHHQQWSRIMIYEDNVNEAQGQTVGSASEWLWVKLRCQASASRANMSCELWGT